MKSKTNQSTIVIMSSIVFLLVAFYILQQFDVSRKFECKNSLCVLQEQRFLGMQDRSQQFPIKSITKTYSREHALEQGYIYRLYIATNENSVVGIEVAANENTNVIENFKKDLEKYIQIPENDIRIDSAANKNNRYMGIGLLIFATLLLFFGIKEKIKSH